MNQGFLIDTNVLSELMRKVPAPAVLNWFAARPGSWMHVCSISQAEIWTGIALLPVGKRRDALTAAAESLFNQDLIGRCLDFDALAAKHYAIIHAKRRQVGQPISTEDGQIAAIALAHNMDLVTRNTTDFRSIEGLNLHNPWQFQ